MRTKLAVGLGAVLLGSCLSFGSEAAWASPATLNCTTKIDGNVASGSCSGTGTFYIIATCADGSQQTGDTVSVKDGQGTSAVLCPSGATNVRVITS